MFLPKQVMGPLPGVRAAGRPTRSLRLRAVLCVPSGDGRLPSMAGGSLGVKARSILVDQWHPSLVPLRGREVAFDCGWFTGRQGTRHPCRPVAPEQVSVRRVGGSLFLLRC